VAARTARAVRRLTPISEQTGTLAGPRVLETGRALGAGELCDRYAGIVGERAKPSRFDVISPHCGYRFWTRPVISDSPTTTSAVNSTEPWSYSSTRLVAVVV